MTQAVKPILLDGAMGTELGRRGANIALPLWSARALDEAPALVQQIHAEYVRAGAQVITANTFRTNVRALAKADMAHRARELTFRAVALARAAIAQADATGIVRLAGSIAPVEDCYMPELVPDQATLDDEHAVLARDLADAGVDLILIETQNTLREACAAARAAMATGKPFWVSFTLNAQNDLLSGESLADAVRAVLAFAPQAILVNCVPTAQTESAVRLLRAVTPLDIPIGAYANAGRVDPDTGEWTMDGGDTPEAYAEAAQRWCAAGATLIGGCCGTRPEHVQALAAALRA
ncbi:MAG: homocysteine S-methyltransferase family protein [Anaerolineae bacterium]|nr:homocysteine S-methyltransferase family protein [Anaerolineae bacterium]